jgi:hypothetical protein
MDVAGIISESAYYSMQMVSEIGKLIVLAVGAVIPVVNMIFLGYLARVVRSTPQSNHLPPLDRWGQMFVDGLNVFILYLCYLAAGVVVTTVLAVVAGVVPLLLMGLMVVFAGYLLLPMALVHSIKTGNPSKGFAVGELVKRIVAVGWPSYLVWVTVTFFGPVMLYAGLLMVPGLGWLIAVFLVPIVGTFTARAAALVYS